MKKLLIQMAFLMFTALSASAQADLTAPSLASHATLAQNNGFGLGPPRLADSLAAASATAKAKGLPNTGLAATLSDDSTPLRDVPGFYQKFIVCLTDAVVVGHATGNSAYHLSASGATIYADYDLQVASIVMNKTPVGKNIVVTRPGGTLAMNGLTVSYDDESYPRLMPGIKYLFFLHYLPQSDAYEPMGGFGTFVENQNNWKIARKKESSIPQSSLLAQGTFESTIQSWISQCPKK